MPQRDDCFTDGNQVVPRTPKMRCLPVVDSLHYTKPRQLVPTEPPISITAPASASDFLADITASAWSTSPINTGYPFYNEFPSLSPSNEPVDVTSIREPAFDISGTYWSLSPANAGAWISDESIFSLRPRYNFPLRSAEAYDNIMASDEDYAAFLDKAAADRQPASTTQAQTSTRQKTVDTQQLHPALQNVHEHVYVSDADEAFEPVSLQRTTDKSSAIGKAEIAQLAGVEASGVEELSKQEFDPRNEYDKVWQQVTEASEATVKAFKIERSGARSEYWILGVSKDGHVVGARATAVES
ncbi:MAG: hypothetical protein Q9159_004062 [Coniocarpon cinnabarinum]